MNNQGSSDSGSSQSEREQNDEQSQLPEIPLATVREYQSRVKAITGSSRLWIATAVCAVVALILLIMAFGSGGTQITIAFLDGFGIKPGDTLRFRGIDVGQVIKVDVNSDLDGVLVRVDLQQNASELARQGSQFWIERPQFGLARISGLETVVGAKFIGVIPGESTGSAQYRFVGIESPPVIRDGSGTQITIQFEDGHGITTGDVVRHLGIVIGEVTAVTISDQLNSVTAHVRLAESAARVARAGSQFWIERPEIGLAEIRGLATLVQGPYIDFQPGPTDGPLVSHFVGASHAPAEKRLADGLEVVLTSRQQKALKTGVPVTYRGLKVGHVVSVGLASDASAVQARVYIRPEYKVLVRANSQFWSNVGLDADLSVRGIKLRTDSLQSLAVGSIGFATPTEPGRLARTGDQFSCAESLKAEWLDWVPKLAVGQQMLPPGGKRPTAIRSTIQWDHKRLGFTQSTQNQGWVLLTDDQRLLGLPRYLQPYENALEDRVNLEMLGLQFPWKKEQFNLLANLATYQLEANDWQKSLRDHPVWPTTKIRRPNEKEDCLIVTDPHSEVVPLSASNIDEISTDRFQIAASIAYDSSLDGACVISAADANLLGFLDLEKGQASIIFVNDVDD